MGHMSDGGRQTGEPSWRRASFCASNECVEVAQRNGVIFVRSSSEPSGQVLRWTADEWQSFVRGIKAGELDDLQT
jgi:hypothetical protein